MESRVIINTHNWREREREKSSLIAFQGTCDTHNRMQIGEESHIFYLYALERWILYKNKLCS